jgi:hypothetical protein
MGRKAEGRRGRRDEWDEGSPTWVRVVQASQSGGGLEGDAVALNALQWWLSQVAGRATLMVATADKHRAAVGDVSPATKRSQGSPLRRVSTHAEMLSAVRLCEDAFNAADIYMGEDWWRGGPDDEPTTDVEEMPYIDATACHAEMLSAGRVPMRQYYLYKEHGGASPSAAIIVEALCPAVWIVGVMGSCQPGHGRRALAELQRLAFASGPGKGCHAIVLEALDGATIKRQRLVQFYESCGFGHCGNTPSHLNSADSTMARAELAERLYGAPIFPGGSFSAETLPAIQLEVATESPAYASSSSCAKPGSEAEPMACDDASLPEETRSPVADRPDEPEDAKQEGDILSASTPAKASSQLAKTCGSPARTMACDDASSPDQLQSPAGDRPDEPSDVGQGGKDCEGVEKPSTSTTSEVSALAKRSPSLVFAVPDGPAPRTLVL